MNKMLARYVPPYVFWPILVVAVLVGLILVGTVLLITGSNPFTVRNLGTQDLAGQAREQFHAGEFVVVKREVCTSREVALTFYPSMRSAEGVMLTLPSGATQFTQGCRHTLFGFRLPEGIRPGRYTYQNLVQYQTNLIGRDEANVYPPLSFEVVANDP